MKRQVLIISYFFPPASSTGGTRPLKFVKYLRNFGWNPVVLTVRKVFDYGVPEDQRLLAEIPEGTKVYRTWSFEPLHWYWQRKTKNFQIKNQGDECPSGLSSSAYKRSWKKAVIDLFHIPDDFCGWIPFGVFAGLTVLYKEKPAIIFATSPCPSALVIGYLLSKFCGVPLVVDYRDPWTDPCAGFDKGSFIKKIHCFWERRILNHARKIICVSETRLGELLGKYSIDPKKGAVITNGYDQDDLKDICIGGKPSDLKIKMIHPGQLYDNHAVEKFLLALDRLIKEKEISEDSVHIKFIGSCPDLDIFKDLERRKVCRYMPRMPKNDVLRLMNESDVFLLFLSDSVWSRGWIVSKIFDYMLFLKPVIGVVPQGETQRIIDKCGMGFAVGHDEDLIKNVLKNIYERHCSGDLQHAFAEELKNYDRRELTRRLADVFDQIATGEKL